MTGLKAYSKADYFKQLSQDIKDCTKGDRILVGAMSFDQDEPLVAELFKALAEAASRGTTTTLIVDAYSFLIGKHNLPGPLLFSRSVEHYSLQQFSAKTRALDTLRAHGVSVGITNLPARRFSNPFAGRSHAKYAVINDTAYIGGCNLDSSIDYDLMLGYENRQLADWLYLYAQDLIQNNGRSSLYRQDYRLDINSKTQLLLDSGIAGQSAILQQAYKVIDRAQKDLMLTCMLFPDGSVMQHLINAHKRGVQVRLICNHPKKLRFPDNLYHTFQMQRHRNRVPVNFYDHQLPQNVEFLHLKVLVSEQATIVGSHNFVDIGVKLGTIEMALYIEDSSSVSIIRQFVENMLGESKI